MSNVLVPALKVMAAGSLRHALPGCLPAPLPDMVFGPAGALRRRIEQGEPCDLHLSADMAHPRALAARIPGASATCFARNTVVAVGRPALALTPDTFLDVLLDPAVRLGTSTPGADPGGDYALALFRKAGLLRPGADQTLAAKAQHLVGGWNATAAGPTIGDFLADGTVDVFLCYRTTALALAGGFIVVPPPAALQIIAEYGGVVLATEPDRHQAAARLLHALLSPTGQHHLQRHGFSRPR